MKRLLFTILISLGCLMAFSQAHVKGSGVRYDRGVPTVAPGDTSVSTEFLIDIENMSQYQWDRLIEAWVKQFNVRRGNGAPVADPGDGPEWYVDNLTRDMYWWGNGIWTKINDQSGGGSTDCVDATWVSSDTLFIRQTDCNIDTILFSLPVATDTAFIHQGKLVIVWNGNLVDSDTIPIGGGAPPIQTAPSGDSILVSFSNSNIAEINATDIQNYIGFTGTVPGGEYTLKISQLTDSLGMDQHLFIVDENGDICNTQIKHTNSILRFYYNGVDYFVTSASPPLQCFNPILSGGGIYADILTYASSLGYGLPSNTVQTAGNNLVNALQTAEIWDSLDQFFVFATDGDSNFSLINWKTPGTNNAATIGTPVFTSMAGWSTDATISDDQVLNLNYNPTDDAVNWKQDFASFGFEHTGSATANGFHFGANPNPKARAELNSKAFLNSTNEFIHPAYSYGGLVQYTVSAGDITIYKDGTTHATSSYTTTGLSNTDLYLGALNLNSSGDIFGEIGGITYRVYYSGGDLSSYATVINTAINNYLTAIGL